MPLSAARVLLHPPKRYALYFDGEDDYVEVAHDPVITFTNEDFTITFYANLVYGSNDVILSKGAYESDGWYIQQRPYRRISLFTNQAGAHQETTTSENVFEDGEWFYSAVVRRGTKAYIYINGEDKTETQPDIIDPITNTRNLYIMRYEEHGYESKGTIAFIRIYNRALSATEIQHNYLNPMSPVLDGLVLWLKMEEGSGTTVHDYSGYGNDGTIYGATWKEITHPAVRTLSPVRILSNVR